MWYVADSFMMESAGSGTNHRRSFFNYGGFPKHLVVSACFWLALSLRFAGLQGVAARPNGRQKLYILETISKFHHAAKKILRTVLQRAKKIASLFFGELNSCELGVFRF